MPIAPMAVVEQPDQRARVRVWDDRRLFAEIVAPNPLAERYAAMLTKRFALPITIDPVLMAPDQPTAAAHD